ncbi:hypothetical protein ACCT30_17095 [Rhizobium ruizarguesonis]
MTGIAKKGLLRFPIEIAALDGKIIGDDSGDRLCPSKGMARRRRLMALGPTSLDRPLIFDMKHHSRHLSSVASAVRAVAGARS